MSERDAIVSKTNQELADAEAHEHDAEETEAHELQHNKEVALAAQHQQAAQLEQEFGALKQKKQRVKDLITEGGVILQEIYGMKGRLFNDTKEGKAKVLRGALAPNCLCTLILNALWHTQRINATLGKCLHNYLASMTDCKSCS